jgi:signal transduction histidine kinase
VINLLSDAIKYNQGSGSVKVDCTSAAKVRASDVTDSGSLNAEQIGQLFQPFNPAWARSLI